MTGMELRVRPLDTGAWLAEWEAGDCVAACVETAGARWIAVADVLVSGCADDSGVAMLIARASLAGHTGSSLAAVALPDGLLAISTRDGQRTVIRNADPAPAGVRSAVAAYVAWVSGGPLPVAESRSAIRASSSSAAGSPASA